MTVKMILDCDTGVDDTMAIMYAALPGTTLVVDAGATL